MAFWLGAVLLVVLATIFYQPAAAKTGALLVWTRDRVYVMDIDTLDLQRVGPATADKSVVPSPGCFVQNSISCWVLIADALYQIDVSIGGNHQALGRLPVTNDFYWPDNSRPSWSPDGVTVAYTGVNPKTDQADLFIYNLQSNTINSVPDTNIDPTLPVAWAAACENGLSAAGCALGYKKVTQPDQEQALLAAYVPATGTSREWPISLDPIFELRWAPDDTLLYSRPKRHFLRADNHQPLFQLPNGSNLANLSPDAHYAVYYQPFKLEGCQTQDEDSTCLHLGVWLNETGATEDRRLIYSVNLSDESRQGGLNFIPVWRPDGKAFVFFQDGRLIHYDLEKQEGTIWYKPTVSGKLRSVPIFSPDGEAIAFVDNQGQGYSEYRLVVINPRLQPVEEVLQEDAFKILAWLSN